jgi:hypothetical protein
MPHINLRALRIRGGHFKLPVIPGARAGRWDVPFGAGAWTGTSGRFGTTIAGVFHPESGAGLL